MREILLPLMALALILGGVAAITLASRSVASAALSVRRQGARAWAKDAAESFGYAVLRVVFLTVMYGAVLALLGVIAWAILAGSMVAKTAAVLLLVFLLSWRF